VILTLDFVNYLWANDQSEFILNLSMGWKFYEKHVFRGSLM